MDTHDHEPRRGTLLDWSDLLRSMVKQGPGWVLLGYIVWWGTVHAQSEMSGIQAIVQTQVTTTVQVADLMKQHLDSTVKYQRAMLELQTETCLGQANTPKTAEHCRTILYDAEMFLR